MGACHGRLRGPPPPPPSPTFKQMICQHGPQGSRLLHFIPDPGGRLCTQCPRSAWMSPGVQRIELLSPKSRYRLLLGHGPCVRRGFTHGSPAAFNSPVPVYSSCPFTCVVAGLSVGVVVPSITAMSLSECPCHPCGPAEGVVEGLPPIGQSCPTVYNPPPPPPRVQRTPCPTNTSVRTVFLEDFIVRWTRGGGGYRTTYGRVVDQSIAQPTR